MRFRRRRPRANPAWGLHKGDRLLYQTTAGVEVTLEVIESVAPDDAFDYVRVYAMVVQPADLDLRDPEHEDSIVPVGEPAEEMSLSDLSDNLDAWLLPSKDLATPGLVVVAAEESDADDEPGQAGFRISGREAPFGPANGYAVLLGWQGLARRLDRAALSADEDVLGRKP